jgi:pyridoxine 5'-phosphate synthase PdxJ
MRKHFERHNESEIESELSNIGHSIIARAALVGMERAVKDMLDLVLV